MYSEVMDHHVKRMIQKGISGDNELHQGYPKREGKYAVPSLDEVYKLYNLRKDQPNATKTHINLPFLRQHSFHKAINGMKNACLYPIKIKKPHWNNFPQYLYTFHAHYCAAEGLHMLQDMTWRVLLYLFYGEYRDGQKTFPIIRCLHYKTSAGRHRFGKFVTHHFNLFLQAFKKNPEWTVFFDDLGAGSAPLEYLILVELGLRSFGTDIHAMGSGALSSEESWFQVPVWRKREAYIALIRFIRGHHSYPQWESFKLEDYAERQALNKTFLVRHFPLTNGKDPLLKDHIEDKWDKPLPNQPSRKRVKREPKLKPSAKEAVVAATAKPMVWDIENRCFVPFD